MSRAPGRGPARFPRPILDARLGDGSRVAICVPPASPHVAITVRRFGTRSFSAVQLIAQGALPAHIRDEAERVLHTRRNILVSGGTASGKTTPLNALIALIPDDQRIVAIEDTLELRIDSPNCVRFEARRLQQGAVTIRDLVRHALRHRPDHIVVGEVRGAESGRPVASPQHGTRRLAHHRPCEQRRQRPVPLGELRDAGRRRSRTTRRRTPQPRATKPLPPFPPATGGTAPIAQHLPPLYELIEQGKVLALNMPAGINPALARAVGVMLKNAWLQALLMRPAKMKRSPGRYFRPAVFICDEYQAFASVGEDDPSGDEKSFALTRQCRCIPIVATQSISSLRAVLGSSEAWRSLLQTLRTRIFLSLSDDASAKIAFELCGQVAKIKESYTISETSKRSEVSPLSGRAGGGGGSMGATKSFREQREAVFHPRDFALLGNCQAICLPYDGAQSLEPRRVYLKPHYLPAEHSYWRAKEAGQI